MKRIKSKLFSLNTWDAVKAAAVGVGTFLIGLIVDFITQLLGIWRPGVLPTKDQLVSIAIYSFLGYLLKQYVTNSHGLPKPEPKPVQNETFNTLTDSPDSRV